MPTIKNYVYDDDDDDSAYAASSQNSEVLTYIFQSINIYFSINL